MIQPVELKKTPPLHFAVREGHLPLARYLVERGALDPTYVSYPFKDSLLTMAQEGAIPKARLLLDHGADINPVDEEYQSTPLGLAARWGQRKMVAFLLERGADPNTAGAPWATPIAWARKKGHNDIAADLRRSGAQ
jgi:ankyrin repeat protein